MEDDFENDEYSILLGLSVKDVIYRHYIEIEHPDKRKATLRDFCHDVGISVGSLSRITTGKVKKPNLRTIFEIANFLGISSDEIFYNKYMQQYDYEGKRKKRIEEIESRAKTSGRKK